MTASNKWVFDKPSTHADRNTIAMSELYHATRGVCMAACMMLKHLAPYHWVVTYLTPLQSSTWKVHMKTNQGAKLLISYHWDGSTKTYVGLVSAARIYFHHSKAARNVIWGLVSYGMDSVSSVRTCSGHHSPLIYYYYLLSSLGTEL